MTATNNQFLGTAPVGKLLRMFAIPCILSLVIQALYNIVDQIFIGNAGYLPFGNTATGIVYPLTVIALAIGVCIGDGTAATISINQGRGQTQGTARSVGTGLTLGLAISLVLMALSFIFVKPILQFFGASGDAAIFLPDAVEYSTWIIAGFPFFIVGCLLNPIVRADGSPKFAMFAMAAGAVLNIILDPIFLYAAHMGMTGAALATFIGQVVTCLLEVGYLFKLKSFRLTVKDCVPDFRAFGATLKLGVSSFLTQFCIVIIAVVNNIIFSAYFVGTVQNAQGIFNVAFKIFGIVISIAIGVTAGAQPIFGYNYGAQKYDRVKATLWRVLITTIIVGVVATVLFETVPEFLLSLFGYSTASDNTAAEIAFGVNAFRIYMGLILVTCLIKSLSIFFQAIGKPVSATVISLLRDVVFIVPLAITLPLISTDAFMWSSPLSDLLTAVVAAVLLVVTLRQMRPNAQAAAVSGEVKPVALQPSHPGLIITIAREHGAGGRVIGKKLAEKLGVPYYDKEITALAAEESGLAAEYIHDLEKKTSIMYNTYLATTVNQTAIAAQAAVLRKIADQGACVIVGRAANVVLADYQPFRIFIYAPMAYRVARVRRTYEDTLEKAKANIKRADDRRAKFYQTVTGQAWADATNYDLVLDGSVGEDAAVDAIVAALPVK